MTKTVDPAYLRVDVKLLNMKPLFILAIIIGLPGSILAQAPVIQNIEPLNAAPNDTIVITGSGFNSTPANLDVWFGAVKATVISSSDFAVEVRVPPQARLTNVELVNRVTGLSAKSNLKFMPSLRTEAFNTTKFAPVVAFTAPEELWDLCTCDLNVDGKPDIAATKFTSASSSFSTSTDIMVLQNNSTPGNLTVASFQKLDKTNLPVLNLTFGTDHVVCGDLQGDGYPELVVSRAGPTRNSIHIFRNTTVGTALNFALAPQLLLDVGHFATRLSLRDLNRDGKPEIIVTNSFNDFLYIFINQSAAGTLSFNPTPVKLSIKINAGDVLTTYETQVQDFNGDGLPDLVINQFQTSDLYLLRNQSTGTISFAAPQKISMPGGLNRLNSADFNNDGKLDLVITSTLNNQLDVLLNQTADDATSFTFAPSISMITSTGPWGVDVSDIDGDGDPDITIANRNQNAINVFLHSGNFTTPTFAKADVPTTLPTRNIRAGDLDGDGKPDLAFTQFNNATSTTQVGILRSIACHKPQIRNKLPLVICNGQTIRLTTAAARNVTFAWTKDGLPTGGDTPYLNITTPGTYQVTTIGESGLCTVASDPVAVASDAANAPATPTITANTPLCIGAALNLQTETVASATYIWNGPNDFTSAVEDPSIASVTDAHAGIYSLQVQVGLCKSEIVTKRVDVASMASFTITSNNTTNTVCDGSAVTLTVNNQADHTYQWTLNGADIAGQTSTSLSASQEGVYTARVTNTTLSCDTETDAVMVTVLQPPIAEFTSDAPGCTEEDVVFTNQSTADARATVVHSWNFGDGFNSSAESPTHAYTTAQSFNATLTVTYQGVAGCSDNVIKPINIVSAVQPAITGTAASSCPDEEVTLSIAGTFASILWSNSATGSSIDVLPGTWSVNTVDANGCAGTDEITITEKIAPTLTASADPETIAAGATAQLNASGADTYSWLPPETLDNPAIATPVASPSTTTTYTVVGTNADGCDDSVQVVVTVAGVATFPVAFSPNGDGQNDIWDVRAETNPDCILSIFDGRGMRIFEKGGENWDGTYKGQAVPAGTYYFVYGCPDQEPLTGNVLVFK
ncbi:MAG: FG-GAP-like repeat-containing protein [Cyclobacteriaceae bacterium]